MLSLQLDLFESNDDVNVLKKRIETLETKHAKLVKSFFSRHTELAKMYLDSENKLEISEKKQEIIENRLQILESLISK